MGEVKKEKGDEVVVSLKEVMASVATSALVAASNATGTSEHHGSHCWEEDGSFHVVCMFVIAISCVCFFITVISVYKIIILVYSSCKENEDIHSTMKKYKLAPMPRDASGLEMTSIPNHIEMVESVRVSIHDKEDQTAVRECIC